MAVDIEDVRDFFPQDYFGVEEPEDAIFVDLFGFGSPPSIDANPKEIILQRQRDWERRRKASEREEVVREKILRKALTRPHFLPNPPFNVCVNNIPCSKVGRTWATKHNGHKWVMLRRTSYQQVLWSLVKNYVRIEGGQFASKSFSSPIHLIKLWNFYDPVRREGDVRFFWVQTIFN